MILHLLIQIARPRELRTYAGGEDAPAIRRWLAKLITGVLPEGSEVEVVSYVEGGESQQTV